MYPPFPKQMTIALNVTALKISDEGLEVPECRDCHAPVNVHQPDETRPDHLLGTCTGCGAWYLIELGKDTLEAFMFDMPNVTLVHATMTSRGTPARPKKASSHADLRPGKVEPSAV